MATEAFVRHVIGPDGAEALLGITNGAWDDYANEGIPRAHRTTRANIVWDYMVKRCDAVLADMEGVTRVEREDRPLYVLRERIVLRPKKHTRESVTRNIQTKAQAMVLSSGEFPEFEYPVVSFGYKLDRAEAGIDQRIITCPTEPWIIDVAEMAAGQLEPLTALLTGLTEDLSDIEPIRFRRDAN